MKAGAEHYVDHLLLTWLSAALTSAPLASSSSTASSSCALQASMSGVTPCAIQTKHGVTSCLLHATRTFEVSPSCLACLNQWCEILHSQKCVTAVCATPCIACSAVHAWDNVLLATMPFQPCIAWTAGWQRDLLGWFVHRQLTCGASLLCSMKCRNGTLSLSRPQHSAETETAA